MSQECNPEESAFEEGFYNKIQEKFDAVSRLLKYLDRKQSEAEGMLREAGFDPAELMEFPPRDFPSGRERKLRFKDRVKLAIEFDSIPPTGLADTAQVAAFLARLSQLEWVTSLKGA